MNTAWREYLDQIGELRDGRLYRVRRASPEPSAGWIGALSCMVPVAVTGADAKDFLQGQLSADLNRLSEESCLLTAWHDARGRVQSLMYLLVHQDRLVLVLPEEQLDPVLKRLQMYVLRQDVHFERLDEETVLTGIFAEAGSAAAPGTCLAGIPDFSLHLGSVAETIDLWDSLLQKDWQVLSWDAWRAIEIRLGIPRILPETAGSFLPQFLDLERFEGLHYDKGCYIGQEVIARTHHLGTVKRGLYQAQADGSAQPGDEIHEPDGTTAGQVLDCAPEESGFRIQTVLRHAAAENPLQLADGTPLESLIRGAAA